VQAALNGDTDALAELTADVIEILIVKKVAGAARNCFIEGTLVWLLKKGLALAEALAMLAHGAPIWLVAELVAIEHVRAGQYVLSRHEDSETAPLTFSRVRETYARAATNLVNIGVTDTTSTSGNITATEEHPFWISAGHRAIPLADPAASGATHTKSYRRTADGKRQLDSHGWVFAGDLRPDDVLSTSSPTQTISVTNRKALSCKATTVYNLNVDDTSTYFVAPQEAPNLCIWVHNGKYGKQHTRKDRKEPGKKEASEPPQLARGKRAHKEEPKLPGEESEVATPSGKRMDRYNKDTCHIREIKPNNPRQIRNGEKQVREYRKEMEEETGKPHTGEVSPYDPDKYK
jgi:hypothetical protein